MELPAIEALLGAPADDAQTLLDYGYRAAWKVSARGDWFIVKADMRDGFQEAEVEAQLHAGRAGVPVPEILASTARPVPAVAMRWVEGVPLQSCRRMEAWREAGRVLRLAHGATVLRSRNVPWGELVQRWLAQDIPYLVNHRGLAGSDADAVLRCAEELCASLNEQALVWLHGDCQAAHFLVDATADRVSAVIDWGDAQEGDSALDFAILSLFEDDVLPHILDGYEAPLEFREHLAATLPLYRALRGAAAARWLDEHGYQDVEWPLNAVRGLARLRRGTTRDTR
jgi:aminoglycoside phosphotransferase (APT) family kinase protein